jgi:quercetin dioxygenase-like cupin family protein
VTEERVRAFVVGPGEGRSLPGPVGGSALIKARTETTGGSFALIENEIPPGEGPPLHVHAAEDEMWLVLSGRLRFRADDQLLDAPEGSFVFMPRGTAHCFQNVGDTTAQIVVMFTPGGMERFFEQHAALAPGPSDPEAYRAIAEANGMTVAGPPLARSHPR